MHHKQLTEKIYILLPDKWVPQRNQQQKPLNNYAFSYMYGCESKSGEYLCLALDIVLKYAIVCVL